MATEANFGDKAIGEVFDRLVSYALQGNRFQSVNQHEPKNAPGNGISCSIWIQDMTPARLGGQAATSWLVVFNARIYMSFTSQPYDMIDPRVTAAALQMIAALSGDFNFGSIPDADIRHVDLLGANGVKLGARAGYMEIDRHMYRVMTVTIPIVVNDAFTQVG